MMNISIVDSRTVEERIGLLRAASLILRKSRPKGWTPHLQPICYPFRQGVPETGPASIRKKRRRNKSGERHALREAGAGESSRSRHCSAFRRAYSAPCGIALGVVLVRLSRCFAATTGARPRERRPVRMCRTRIGANASPNTQCNTETGEWVLSLTR